MAEFSSPIYGGIRIARRRIPSASIFGALPFAPASTASTTQSGPDPETIRLLSRNELALSSVANQLGGISRQVNDLAGSLAVASTNINLNSLLDRQREIQKLNLERRLAEQQLREGKESVIERKMQNALVFPVQKVAQKAQITLSRVMSFFTILLGGWLYNQSVQAIRAYATGNTQRLNQIRNHVLKNLAIIGGIYLAIRIGFTTLANISSRIVGRIFTGVFAGLFLNPVKALINAVKNAGKSLVEAVTPGAKKGAAEGATGAAEGGAAEKGAVEGLEKGGAEGLLGGVKGIGGGLLKGAGNAVVGGFEFLQRKQEGQTNLQAGAGTLGSLGAAETLGTVGAEAGTALGPVGALVGGVSMSALGFVLGGKGVDLLTGANKTKPEKTSAASKPSTKTTTPTTTKTPSASDLTMASSNQAASMSPTTAAPDAAKTSPENVTPSSTLPPTATPASTQNGSQFIAIPKAPLVSKTQNIGPLPEPTPNVVMAPATQAPTQQPTGSSGGGSSTANSVPSIPSGNPNNFYSLYAQSHYNVVM